MPGLSVSTLTKQGCFDADVMNALNTTLGNLNAGTGGIVGSTNNGAVPFGNYTTGGTALTLVASGAPAGTYRVTIYAVITTTFTGATTVGHTLGYTDDQGARTTTNALGALTAGTLLTSTQTIRSTGAAAITVTEIATGANATAGAMALSVVVERLL